MKRAWIMLLWLMPSAVIAQEGVVIPNAQAPQERQAPPAAPPPDTGGRRRPSMVGYVNDSDIATQVRVRFDSGYNVKAADRSEFFYAKSGIFRTLPATNPNYDPNAPGPGPGNATRLNFQQLYIHAEYAPSPRLSIFGEIPLRFIQPKTFSPANAPFDDHSGFSDVPFGVKAGLASTDRRQITASVQFTAPSGDPLNGLGTDHWSIEPALLYHERAGIVSVESQIGVVFPTDGSAGIPTSSSEKFAGKVLYWGVGPSVEIVHKGNFALAPIAELVGWHFIGGFQTGGLASVDKLDVVNAKLGARLLFGQNSVYVGYGRALTHKWIYEQILRVEYRVGFGR